jgi:hypothetical protein
LLTGLLERGGESWRTIATPGTNTPVTGCSSLDLEEEKAAEDPRTEEPWKSFSEQGRVSCLRKRSKWKLLEEERGLLTKRP